MSTENPKPSEPLPLVERVVEVQKKIETANKQYDATVFPFVEAADALHKLLKQTPDELLTQAQIRSKKKKNLF